MWLSHATAVRSAATLAASEPRERREEADRHDRALILGGGKTIFPDDGALRTLELVSTVTSGTGVHVCTYRPVAEG
jgi:hypothetical protein